MLEGRCLCGLVSFRSTADAGPVEVCHCVQCRKWTGHVFDNIEVPRTALTVTGAAHVRWYASSAKARRGFCGTCGSTLFFDPLDTTKHAWIAIAMGALDTSTGCRIALHIYTAEKGDYYDIPDGEAIGPR
ncbi:MULTISPECIES: GFA family protein [Luteimonas]|uniref:GFA family protein n=1 Tax=Luteimonas TaxID=83614 RepID=UPI000C7C730C|nr:MULTISPECIES: GFA family protein [Luteimonas]